MHRLILISLAAALGFVAACEDEDESAEEFREEQAEVAEEHREMMEELREDHMELHERMQQLPPEERQRLREQMHRDMQRYMQRDTAGAMPGQGSGMSPHHPRGQGPGMGPDTLSGAVPPDAGTGSR